MSTNFGSNRAKRAESAWRDRDDVANRNQRETGNSHQQKRLKKKKKYTIWENNSSKCSEFFKSSGLTTCK